VSKVKGRIADLSLVAASSVSVRSWPLSNTRFLGPRWVSPQNGIWIDSSVVEQLHPCAQRTNRQTHRSRYVRHL